MGERIFELVQLGGPIMVPLMVLNLIILAWGGSRVLFRVWQSLVGPASKVSEPFSATPEGWRTLAISLAEGREAFRGLTPVESMEIALARFEEEMLRGAPQLRFLAQISTLLGFLGTIQGMVKIFHVVAERGAVIPAEIAGGLHEKLYCTWLGLINAIIAVMLAWLIEELAARQMRKTQSGLIQNLLQKNGAGEK